MVNLAYVCSRFCRLNHLTRFVMSERIAKVVPVLMYHHVTPAGGSLNCSPKNFKAQMEYLANHGYTTLTSKQFARFLNGEPVPDKSVVLTFDDGYLDNYVYAHPILKKYELNAHMFLVSSWVHDEEARPAIDGSRAYPFCPTHEECKQRLKNARIDDVIVRWSEVQIMQESKTFEFHSHSHTHTRWDKQLNQEGKMAAILNEMQQSKEAFQEHLGQVSEHFCWPQGYYEPDYVQIAQEQGFKYLYTTDGNGFNQSGEQRSHIYRNWVGNLGTLRFAFKLWITRHPRCAQWYRRLDYRGRRRKAAKLAEGQALN